LQDQHFKTNVDQLQTPMQPQSIEPNDPPPEMTSVGRWDDADSCANAGLAAATILPPRRTAKEAILILDEAAPLEQVEPGLRIQPKITRKDNSEGFEPLVVQEIVSNVVRLEPTKRTKTRLPKLVKFIERGLQLATFTNPFGEGNEWGKSKQQPILWMLGVGGGIITLIVGAITLLPSINRSNTPRNLPPERYLKVVENEVGEGFETLSQMFEKKAEASKIFLNYSRATTVDEALPFVRNSENLEELIRREWKPTNIPKDWAPSKDFKWQVSESSGSHNAILEGTLPDFTAFSAYFTNKDNQLLMDWKATTGHSSATYEELAKGTGDASEVRGTLILSNFYTSTWPENEYLSFQLVSPSGDSAIWCYVSRRAPTAAPIVGLFKRGTILREGKGPKKVTLHLTPGAPGCLPNQWLITKLLHPDWITH